MLNLDELINKYNNTFQEKKCFQSFIEFENDYQNDDSKVSCINNTIEKLFNKLFANQEMYVILFIWNTHFMTERDLLQLGFDYRLFDKVYENISISDHQLIDNPENTKVNLLYIKNFNYDKIKILVQAIATWELALSPSAQVSAYFIHFSKEFDILINFHDDRWLEILSTSQELNQQIKENFSSFPRL